jgi:hypothetical protein
LAHLNEMGNSPIPHLLSFFNGNCTSNNSYPPNYKIKPSHWNTKQVLTEYFVNEQKKFPRIRSKKFHPASINVVENTALLLKTWRQLEFWQYPPPRFYNNKAIYSHRGEDSRPLTLKAPEATSVTYRGKAPEVTSNAYTFLACILNARQQNWCTDFAVSIEWQRCYCFAPCFVYRCVQSF